MAYLFTMSVLLHRYSEIHILLIFTQELLNNYWTFLLFSGNLAWLSPYWCIEVILLASAVFCVHSSWTVTVNILRVQKLSSLSIQCSLLNLALPDKQQLERWCSVFISPFHFFIVFFCFPTLAVRGSRSVSEPNRLTGGTNMVNFKVNFCLQKLTDSLWRGYTD